MDGPATNWADPVRELRHDICPAMQCSAVVVLGGFSPLASLREAMFWKKSRGGCVDHMVFMA